MRLPEGPGLPSVARLLRPLRPEAKLADLGGAHSVRYVPGARVQLTVPALAPSPETSNP